MADLIATTAALQADSRSGVSRLLRRLGVRLKRGRLRLHRPDPAYAERRDAILAAQARARAHPTTHVLLYADEASCLRQPTLAARWHPIAEEPAATLSQRANTRHRLCAGLDAVSGRVVWTAGSKTTIAHLKRWLQMVRAANPDRALTIVWDNWPVHAHPEVLAEAARLAIAILWLPTYAPWLNPIEKLWRWLKQTLVHHHALADDWEALKAAMHAFLDQFDGSSADLLRYVGLRSD